MENETNNLAEAATKNIDGILMLAAGVSVQMVADQYQQQENFAKAQRSKWSEQILELERLISESHNWNIYKVLYKGEYGDYREYVNKVAEELRYRNACG